MNSKPEVLVTNFNPRFTGVSATTAAVLNVQKNQISAALVGKSLYGCPAPLSKSQAITFSRLKPHNKPFSIWHVRRNTEMQLALFVKNVLRYPIKIVFTSAAQRRHSAWPRWLISKMDAVIATTEEAACFVPNVVSVIPHGVDIERFSPSKDSKKDWGKTGLPGEYGIINVGRIRPEKGTDLFVEAMIKSLPQLPGATAIIAGIAKAKDSNFKKHLEKQIRDKGMSDRILFLGEVSPGRLPDLMRGCKALVALPRYEGFGLTPLEAMACGLPVVASKTGHFQEFLKPLDDKKACGMVVSIEDHINASNKLVELLSNQTTFQKFSKNARSEVIKKYSVLKEAEEINKIYEKLWNGEIC